MTDIQKQTAVLSEPQILTVPARTLVGINARYSCENRSGIPAQWSQFGPHIGHIPGQVNGMSYGVSHHQTSDGMFDYLCAVEVAGSQSPPAGFTALHLDSQRVAVFRHRGPADKIPAIVDAIFSEWLPSSNYLVHGEVNLIEQYSEDFNPVSGAGWVDLCVPVRSHA